VRHRAALLSAILAGCNLATSGPAPGSGANGGGPGTCQPPLPPAPPAEAGCLGTSLLSWAGRNRLLLGLAGSDAAAAAAGYDVRYQYLAGKLPPSGGCATCGAAAGCDSSWWGCWQENGVPPGLFVGRFIAAAKARGQLPWLTYYLVLPASGLGEGRSEVAAVNDRAFLTRYLDDWRFLLQKIGVEKVLLHHEPDFWGYGQHLSADPHSIPAQVRAAAPECGCLEDSLAGLGRCLVAMARQHAPNARVGLHASGWASGYDCFGNGYCPGQASEGARVGAWLLAAGAGEGDFVVGDMSDRDADWYRLVQSRDTWWTATNFHNAFTWSKAVAEAVGRPFVWWQTPLGNSAQDNTANHWKDNRVEYLFGHMAEVAAAHGMGVLYGAGEGAQTNPDTDGGLLASSAAAYLTAGGEPLCR